MEQWWKERKKEKTKYIEECSKTFLSKVKVTHVDARAECVHTCGPEPVSCSVRRHEAIIIKSGGIICTGVFIEKIWKLFL